MRIVRSLLAISALILAQVPFARAAEDVDLLLVLAVDVSRSIDQPKFMLQRDGYAAADAAIAHRTSSPNRPCGRSTNTRTIGRNRMK